MPSPIFGIDLGTTNSCLAHFVDSMPQLVPIEGTGIVPSVVSLHEGEFVVGRRAHNRAILEPATTIRSVKRKMGSSDRLALGDRQLLPEEVAAEILRYLKTEGSRLLGQAVERAVITVPAYFEDEQRRATIRAGELAGLEVVRLLNEPTAAALLYDRLVRAHSDPEPGAKPDPDALHRILVYDLGGGTFDVSVVELAQGVDEVRASCGDNRLGGDDFDFLLSDHLRQLVDGAEDLEAGSPAELALRARLQHAAEIVKIELSSAPYSQVAEPGILATRHLDVEVERSLFESLVEDLLDSTLSEVDRALDEAGASAAGIDRVVLVGGSTHIPRVRELLEERFTCPVEHTIDPAECVALGAAIQGAVLDGRVFDHILVDVAPHSLGIKTLGHLEGLRGEDADQFSPIIRRNSRIPVRRAELFYTLVEDQEAVLVEVFQGEDSRCSGNTPIGDFQFELESAPVHSPIVVDLAYDTDGIIRVDIHQKGTENRRQVTLETRSGNAADAVDDASDELDNYMLRKARSLAGSVSDPEQRRRLEEAAQAYAEILADGSADPGEVDLREDALLDLLDEVESATTT